MTYIANPRHYAREDFRALVEGLNWSKGWRPAFPTLHNTGVPSLAQWLGYGASAQERWGANLNRYYEGLGWHAGPHLVCCPDYIWVLCDPEANGVSVSCWNRLTFGIEMVGDYRAGGDDPTTGEGAKVVGNAVFALAVLARKLGWSVGTLVKGVGGLHFHRECARDGHPCPGDRIDKADILARVLAEMGAPAPVAAKPAFPASPPADPLARAKWLQARLNALGASPPLLVDGQVGPKTQSALEDFQLRHALDVDGIAGDRTLAALAAAVG